MNLSGGTINANCAFFVGEGASGTINMTGGRINVVDGAVGMRLGVNTGATGNVYLDGGVLTTPIITQGTGSGTFNFNGGTLRAAANNGTFMNGLTQANVRNGGAIIDSNGFAVTVGQALAHSTIGGDNATDGGLTKIGAGSLTLTANNSYNGVTTVSAGARSSTEAARSTAAAESPSTALQPDLPAPVLPRSVRPSLSRAVRWMEPAPSTLSTSPVTPQTRLQTVRVAPVRSRSAPLTFSGAGNFSLKVGATTPEISATTITTNGTGNVLVNASNSSWSPVTYDLISYGALAGDGFASLQKGVISGLSGRQSAMLGNDTTNKFITLTIGGDNPKWSGALSSNWTTTTLANPKNWQLITSGTPTDYIQGDIVLFDETASNFTVNISDADVSPTSTTFSNQDYTVNGPFGIAGSGSLAKNNGGALTINTSNSYSGGTSLNGGTLNINNPSALGTGGLVIAGSTTINNTSGTPVTLSTNNPQTWNGNFTFGGANDLNLGTGSVTFTSTRTITVNGSAALTVGGDMNGGVAGLVKQGSGKLVLGGSNNYAGSTVLNQGTLQIASGVTGVIGTDIQIAPNPTDVGTLVLSSGTLNAYRVVIAGASTNDTNAGTGVLTQTGGVINSAAWFTVGSGGSGSTNTGGTGTYNLSGGTLNLTTQQMEVANFTGASGAVNMTGGAINVGNSNFISMGATTTPATQPSPKTRVR